MTLVGKSEYLLGIMSDTFASVESNLYIVIGYLFVAVLVCRHQRARPIIIDPGLYHSKKSGVFWAKEKRPLPASFKLFTGYTSLSSFLVTRLIQSFLW